MDNWYSNGGMQQERTFVFFLSIYIYLFILKGVIVLGRRGEIKG